MEHDFAKIMWTFLLRAYLQMLKQCSAAFSDM